MAIIVKDKGTKEKYILLGTGFGAYKSSKSTVFVGNRVPTADVEETTMIAVSNSEGKIVWISSEDLEVIKVDGKSPKDILE